MCGRFTIRNENAFQNQFGGQSVSPSFNIAPGNKITTMTDKLSTTNWGFTPLWADKPFNLVNARFETLSTKPSFRDSSRCLIPADGWYEWKIEEGIKTPYFHHLDGDIFCFGGVYGGYRGQVGCAVVTTEASDHLTEIHERMPFIVHRSHYKDWLASNDGNFIDQTATNRVKFYAVSTYVNNPQNADQKCIEKIVS